MNTILNLTKAMGAEVPADTFILASARFIEDLNESSSGTLQDMHLVAHEASEPVPDAVIRKAKVLVLEVDPATPSSLARISDIRDRHPQISLVAAIHQADFKLVRALLRHGIEDVVEIPFNAQDLVSELIGIHARQSEAESKLAPMVAIVGAAGGVGTTTVLTHLASVIAEGRSCCLVDLDIQSGQSSYLMDISPAVTVQDLLEASERLDGQMLRDATIEAPSGVHVLGAPPSIGPLEDIDVDRLLHLLTIARSEFDVVLLDVPAAWTNWSLSIACACDALAIVVDQSIGSLRGAKRVLDLFDVADIQARNTGLILNKVERRLFKTIGSSDIADALARQIWGEVSFDREALHAAQNRCELIWSEAPRSAFGKDVRALAGGVTEKISGASA